MTDPTAYGALVFASSYLLAAGMLATRDGLAGFPLCGS